MMFKFKSNFKYVVSNTLTGKKLLMGVPQENSYIEIPITYFDSLLSLIHKLEQQNLECLEPSCLTETESSLYSLSYTKGFLSGLKSTPSFNEYSNLTTIFWEYKFSSVATYKINTKFSAFFLFLLWLFGILLILDNINFITTSLRINIKEYTLSEFAFCSIILPQFIYFSHELGHFLVAKLMNVTPKHIKFGFFICFTTIYIEYEGLNLNETYKKLSIISAGILIHIYNIILGIYVIEMTPNFSKIVMVWIVANFSMIISNILFFSPSDGYFFITNLIGIYNLRYRGYKALYLLLNNSKISKIKTGDLICCIILTLFLLLSFIALFKSILFYGSIFNLNTTISLFIAIVLMIMFFLRLLVNIKNLKIII